MIVKYGPISSTRNIYKGILYYTIIRSMVWWDNNAKGRFDVLEPLVGPEGIHDTGYLGKRSWY